MNEIDIRTPGGVQTYSPSQSLAPAPDWGTTELTNQEYTQRPGGQTVFGQPLPPGVSIEQVMQGYKELGNVFVADFMKLGHNVTQTQKAVKWFMDAITNPPQQQQKRHSYNLYEHTNDALFQAFANYAAVQKFSAKFVTDACWWVTEASKRLNAQSPEGSREAHGSAPTSTEVMLSRLSDKDYNAVIAINEKALANTMQVLQERWGDYTFRQNIDIAQDYLSKLPAADQQFFDKFSGNWIHLRNTVEFITAMFDAATGAHNLPKDGSGIAREIAECERCMKTNPKQWRDDNALQARYRTLLDRRDGR